MLVYDCCDDGNYVCFTTFILNQVTLFIHISLHIYILGVKYILLDKARLFYFS